MTPEKKTTKFVDDHCSHCYANCFACPIKNKDVPKTVSVKKVTLV